MEKYTKWRDPGTGIHPFLPYKGKTDYSNSISQVLWTLKRVILGSVLAILRFPLIAAIFLVTVVCSYIFALIPVAFAKRLFTSLIQFVGARLILFIMGFYWIETKYFPLSKQRGKSSNSNSIPGFDIKSGDVIIANFTSYVDILYLTFRFAPQFAIVPNTWSGAPPKGKVIPLSLLGILSDMVNFPFRSVDEGKSLGEVVSAARKNGSGPVVVFPEGVTSNGLIILDGLPILANADVEPSRVHVLGFKYEYEDFSPTYPVGSFFAHLFRLLSQIHNSLQVRYMAAVDMPPLPLDGSSRRPVDSDKAEWADAVYRNLASILQIRKATLNAMDKREFVKYWYSHKKSYKED